MKWGAAVTFVVAALIFGLGTADAMVARWLVVYVFTSIILLGSWHFFTRINTPILIAAVFLGYVSLTLLWSPDPADGLLMLRNYLAGFVVFYLVVMAKDSSLIVPMIAASVIGAVAYGYFITTPGANFGNENFQAEFLIVALPFLLIPQRNKFDLWAIVSGLTGLVYLFLYNDTKIKYFALLGLFVAFLWWLIRNKHYHICMVLVLMAIWPFVAWFNRTAEMFNSLLSRLELFTNSAFVWFENPIFGVGLGGFNYYYSKHQEQHIQFFDIGTVLSPIGSIAGSVHNEFLQVLVNYGVVGVALAVFFAGSIYRKPFQGKLSCAAGWSLFLVLWLSLIGFPLQNPPSLVLALISTGILARGAASFKAANPLRLVVVVMALSLSLALAATIKPTYRAEAMFKHTRLHLGPDPLSGLKSNLSAYQEEPGNATYRRQLLISMLRATTKRKNTQISLPAARKIRKISLTTSEFNPAHLAAWGQFLLNQKAPLLSEVEEILSIMKERHRLQAETWLMDAWMGYLTKDEKRINNATLQAGLLPQHHEKKFATIYALFKESVK